MYATQRPASIIILYGGEITSLAFSQDADVMCFQLRIPYSGMFMELSLSAEQSTSIIITNYTFLTHIYIYIMSFAKMAWGLEEKLSIIYDQNANIIAYDDGAKTNKKKIRKIIQ